MGGGRGEDECKTAKEKLLLFNYWNIDNETETDFIYGTKSKISFWTVLICYKIVPPKNLCTQFDIGPNHYTAESNGEQ